MDMSVSLYIVGWASDKLFVQRVRGFGVCLIFFVNLQVV